MMRRHGRRAASALLTWRVSPDIGLVAPALAVSALTYERAGALHTTLDAAVQVGVALRF